MRQLWIALTAMVCLSSGSLFANEGKEVVQASTEQVATEQASAEQTTAAADEAATQEKNG
ncbi:MAG: hypothetical protein HYX48_00230 [Chlamydiales bacterium]|nr:hypothetical protein [Chlamydiales bacterium]